MMGVNETVTWDAEPVATLIRHQSDESAFAADRSRHNRYLTVETFPNWMAQRPEMMSLVERQVASVVAIWVMITADHCDSKMVTPAIRQELARYAVADCFD